MIFRSLLDEIESRAGEDDIEAPKIHIHSPQEGEEVVGGYVTVSWEVTFFDIVQGYVEVGLGRDQRNANVGSACKGWERGSGLTSGGCRRGECVVCRCKWTRRSSTRRSRWTL